MQSAKYKSDIMFSFAYFALFAVGVSLAAIRKPMDGEDTNRERRERRESLREEPQPPSSIPHKSV